MLSTIGTRIIVHYAPLGNMLWIKYPELQADKHYKGYFIFVNLNSTQPSNELLNRIVHRWSYCGFGY